MARRTVRLTASASRDLHSIRQYSAEAWGSNQSNVYVRSLRSRFRSLEQFPELGLVMPDHHAVRQLIADKHVIYYRIQPTIIEILRIMHERAATPENFD